MPQGMRAGLLTILVCAAMSATAAQTTLKIAVFDPQRVSEETLSGKKAQAELERARDAKQKLISDQEKIIGDLQQQLSEQSLSLSADKRTTMELDIQRRLLELTTAKDLATRQLQLEIAAAEARFNDKLRAVIDRFGREREFTLILDQASVAWASPAVDTTTAIIDLFDSMFPQGSE